MPIQDFEDAFEDLGGSIRRLSQLFDQAREGLESAIEVAPDGSATIDYAALRTALDIGPNRERIDRAIDRLDLGFAMKDGGVVAPWSAFIDVAAVQPFCRETWRALGFGRRDAKPFEEFANVPDAVTAKGNIAMLKEVAANSRTLKDAFSNAGQIVITPMASIYSLLPGSLAKVALPPFVDTSTGTATSQQALAPEDFKGAFECFQGADYSFTGWGFVLSICVDRKCADTIEAFLGLGSGALFAGVMAYFAKGLSAAVSGMGGWVVAGILVSAAAWALAIHTNKTPRGVCLNVPMPWSFGAIGPGWATGI